MPELTEHERDFLFDLFLQYALRETYIDSEGSYRKRFMRQTRIWIQDAKFTQKYKRKRSMHNLLQKKVIVKNDIWGYDFFINEDFKEQIYDLADNEDFELIKQMMTVWIVFGD